MSTTKHYSCATQSHLVPTLGAALASHLHDDSLLNDSLVLGIGNIVPRWDTVKQPNRTLQYFVQTKTFPSLADAEYAADNLRAAANDWNSLRLGINIIAAPSRAAANFYLRYIRSDAGDTTLAQAFFPNETNQDIMVYSFAFHPENKEIMKAVFLHELGHVLGLRHELAIEREGSGAVKFMQSNPKSVMSYNFPPTMQKSDIEGTKAFYKLKNGELIGGQPVTDYLPQVRSAILK